MTDHSSAAAIGLPFTGRLSQSDPSCDFHQPSGLHCALIHTLDDYSLLNIFSLFRPALLGESEVDNDEILEGGDWHRECWWFNLVQVCRRWRYIVLESAPHLRLSLVCTRGSLVADMLAHSPLPLIIDNLDQNHDSTAEDQEGIILAFQHRGRVRRIRLRPRRALILQKLINALDGEFPVLETLYVIPRGFNWHLNLPGTFRAPYLRHLLLGSPVSKSLHPIPIAVHQNALFRWLSLMPQLEALGIIISYRFDSTARLLVHTPNMTHVTLPNLRWLGFQGASTQLEALLPQVTLPHLERLRVYLLNKLTLSAPHQQVISTLGNLPLKTITLTFLEEYINMMAYPHNGARMYTLCMTFDGTSFDWQLGSVADFCHVLGTTFTAVEHLTLKYDRHLILSSEEPYRRLWRKLLGSFGSVKTLYVDGELVEQLSCALQPGEGESPMELLPKLQELSYPAIPSSLDVSTPFIDARQKAGCPVTIVHP